MARTERLRRARLERPWGELTVWSAGEGPPVLAVHGLGGSGRYWQGLAGRLGDRRRVIAPDLPGFGRTEAPREPVDLAMLLDVLDGAVAAATGPVVVVGHSIGGVLAAAWAARHPERVAGLALAASPFPSPDPARDPEGPRRSGGLPLRRRALVGLLRFAWPLITLPVATARRYPRAVVWDYGRQSVPGRLRTLWALLHDPALGKEVAAIRGSLGDARALLVAARDDRVVGMSALSRWAEALPRAERLVLPEGGHQLLLRTGFEPFVRWIEEGG